MLVLVLSKPQVQAFEAGVREGFLAEMIRHCNDFSPQLCKTLGEKQLQVAVSHIMQNAARHELQARGSVRLFVDLSLLFGSGFDTDPQYPWAAELLAAERFTNEMHRAEALHERACEYLVRVGGANNELTRSALGRLVLLEGRELDVQVENYTDDVLRLMSRLHPEKFEYTGTQPLRYLIESSALRARDEYGFVSARAMLVITVLMFSFGHRCGEDPLYPWIRRILVDRNVAPWEHTARKLERRAFTWLRAVLKNT